MNNKHNFFSSVVIFHEKNGSNLGAGFLVSNDGLIITCIHVLESNQNFIENIYVTFFQTEFKYPIAVEKDLSGKDKSKDITIVRIIGKLPNNIKPLELDNLNSLPNGSYRSLGFPFPNTSDGIYAACEIIGINESNKSIILQIRSSEVTVGFSGSPVINSLTGTVIGMITSIARQDIYGRLSETAFAISCKDINGVLSKFSIDKETPHFSINNEQPPAEENLDISKIRAQLESNKYALLAYELNSSTGINSKYSLAYAIRSVNIFPNFRNISLLRDILASPRPIGVYTISSVRDYDNDDDYVVIASKNKALLFDIKSDLLINEYDFDEDIFLAKISSELKLINGRLYK